MKIAILLGEAGLDTLIRARALAQALLAATPLQGGPPQLTIGLPVADDHVWKRDAAWLVAGLPAIVVRRIDWQRIPAGGAVRMHRSRLPTVALAYCSHVMLPRDWGSNFTDCDAWIVLADSGLGGVYPIRPTAYFCAELAARRSPYAFCADFRSQFWDDQLAAFHMWRQAGVVVTTDRLTAQDIVSFAGVSPHRVLHLPHGFDVADLGSAPPAARKAEPMLVRMEPDELNDIGSALRGLRLYRQEGGALVPVIACQVPPEAFRRQSNVAAVAALPAAVRDMLEELAKDGSAAGDIVRLTTPDRWARLLGRSCGVWSPRLSGQGSHLNWPLRFGVSVLSADHPAARDLAQHAGTALALYRPGDPDAVADALHAFEAGLPGTEPVQRLAAPASALLATQAGLILDRLLEMVNA